MNIFYLQKNTIYRLLILSLLFSSSNLVVAQGTLKGTITNSAGDPLPFANIFIKGTSKGTTSNNNGEYTFSLDKGTHQVVFQYIGYQTVEKLVVESELPAELNIVLFPENYEMAEVTVTENQEDPAYSVIRKAIEKRRYYKDRVSSWACDTYVKGMQKIKDAPEKFMGIDLGDLDGALDTNRQGIIYLSESVSKLYFQQQEGQKEIMVSSLVSGNDNGFSFNRASSMDFSLYNNTIQFIKPLVSPIADNAMTHYRYRLESTFVDQQGRLINRIQVTPKRKNTPCLEGYIHIVEDWWLVQAIDLFLTGTAIDQPVLDTLTITQSYLPVENPDVWMLFSQKIGLELSVFGFDIGGYFIGVFSNYVLGETYPSSFFKSETFRVLDSANQKEPAYWENIRPVPLASEEKQDYLVKDSMEQIRNAPAFRDSIERKNNQFVTDNLISGYSFRKEQKKIAWDVSSPLSKGSFNAVQGWHFDWSARFRKDKTADQRSWWEVGTYWNIGFADQSWRGRLKYEKLFNSIDYPKLILEGGREVVPFDEEAAIASNLNLVYSLFLKENYLRLFDKSFFRGTIEKKVQTGLTGRISLEYARRTPLQNQTNYSLQKKDQPYFPNDPLALMPSAEPAANFAPHEALIAELQVTFEPFQKYATYPGYRQYLGTDWPSFSLEYRKAIRTGGENPDFDRIRINIKDGWRMGLMGQGQLFLQAGTFLSSRKTWFTDEFHFNGNQTIFSNSSRFDRSFMLLPYFLYSGTSTFMEVHWNHHFDGWFFQKIPLLRAFGWHLNTGGRALFRDHRDTYYEGSLGISNIGINIFRFLRLDYAWAFEGGKIKEQGLLVGLRISN